MNKKFSAVQPTKPKPTQLLPNNMTWAWDPNGNTWIAVMKESDDVTAPLYSPNNSNTTTTTTTNSYMSTIKSNQLECLNKFLSGEQYSKEINLDKGLIKAGLIEYAGFNPQRGTKYKITEEGLKVLKAAAEQEYNKVKSYLVTGINDGKVETGDSTYKGLMPQLFDIFEIDGSCLATNIEAKDELDAKVKFILKHPEYEDSQTINAKLVQKGDKWQAQSESGRSFGTYDTKEEAKERLKQMEMFKHMKKDVKSDFYETTEKGYDYPSLPTSPHDQIILENHNGWVNTAADKQSFAELHALIGEYRKQDLIESIHELDGNLILTGDPEVINDLEHKVKDIGYYCETVDETVGEGTIPQWSLKIFMK